MYVCTQVKGRQLGVVGVEVEATFNAGRRAGGGCLRVFASLTLHTLDFGLRAQVPVRGGERVNERSLPYGFGPWDSGIFGKKCPAIFIGHREGEPG